MRDSFYFYLYISGLIIACGLSLFFIYQQDSKDSKCYNSTYGMICEKHFIESQHECIWKCRIVSDTWEQFKLCADSCIGRIK